ncbi:MAG TPA: 2-C-methyl-D-erythritol 4-phosphate cytidylyltransferase [Nocardioides sp.]|nr:2-C-methyl-D-erythritol 4-phosphate cytidylyltransferase [Nocardioides sp.]
MSFDPYDVPVSGLILDEDRGDLPYHLVHGEALVAAAAWAAGAAGIDLLDQTTPWEVAVERGTPLVLHDALCPMTPPEFLADCARIAEERDVAVVAVRPVTDTVKEVADGRLGATVDRDRLVAVCSPVVLPHRVVADVEGLPTRDFPALLAWLRSTYDVELVEAPPEARRVATEDDIRVLEALTQPR